MFDFPTQALYMGTAPKPSGKANTKEGKVAILERTKKLIDSSNLILTLPFEGVTKEQVDLLRKEIPKGTTKVSVVKNALMKKSLEGTKFEALGKAIKGETMFFFIPEGESKPTFEALQRWSKEAKRTEPQHKPTAAAMENTLYGAAQVEAVVNLPTKKELITKIAQGIKAVPLKVARGVKAVPNKLGRAFGALKTKLEEEGK